MSSAQPRRQRSHLCDSKFDNSKCTSVSNADMSTVCALRRYSRPILNAKLAHIDFDCDLCKWIDSAIGSQLRVVAVHRVVAAFYQFPVITITLASRYYVHSHWHWFHVSYCISGRPCAGYHRMSMSSARPKCPSKINSMQAFSVFNAPLVCDVWGANGDIVMDRFVRTDWTCNFWWLFHAAKCARSSQ